MNCLIITNSYIKKIKFGQYVILIYAFCLLSGCLGGSVAQQIVRSIATSVADNAVANAMDVNDDDVIVRKNNQGIADRPPTDLALALTHTGFRKTSNQRQALAKKSMGRSIPIIKTTTLVQVKVFNLIIGQEKDAYFTKALRNGAINLPSQQEWQYWFVATGKVEKINNPITFIVPPVLGKPVSGSNFFVELTNIGNINIARHQDNQQKLHQAKDETVTSWR